MSTTTVGFKRLETKRRFCFHSDLSFSNIRKWRDKNSQHLATPAPVDPQHREAARSGPSGTAKQRDAFAACLTKLSQSWLHCTALQKMHPARAGQHQGEVLWRVSSNCQAELKPWAECGNHTHAVFLFNRLINLSI